MRHLLFVRILVVDYFQNDTVSTGGVAWASFSSQPPMSPTLGGREEDAEGLPPPHAPNKGNSSLLMGEDEGVGESVIPAEAGIQSRLD